MSALFAICGTLIQGSFVLGGDCVKYTFELLGGLPEQ